MFAPGQELWNLRFKGLGFRVSRGLELRGLDSRGVGVGVEADFESFGLLFTYFSGPGRGLRFRV